MVNRLIMHLTGLWPLTIVPSSRLGMCDYNLKILIQIVILLPEQFGHINQCLMFGLYLPIQSFYVH